MGYLSDKLQEFQYEPWYIRLNLSNFTSKKALVTCVAVTVSIFSLVFLIMIIVMGRWSFSDIPPQCQTDTNQDCVFPFSYKGMEYSSCTTADNHGVPWCSTSTDHIGQYVNGRWGNCQETCPTGCKTVSGPDPGKLCLFPFKWDGVVYRECTTHTNNGLLWCATHVDHLGNTTQWGNCDVDTCPGCRTTAGTMCQLPFIYNNVTHNECVEDSETKKLWCLSAPTDGEGDRTVVRAECRPGCAIGCHTHSGTPCKFPFKYNGTEYSKCTMEENGSSLQWCATQTDQEGNMVDGMWEYCHAGCS